MATRTTFRPKTVQTVSITATSAAVSNGFGTGVDVIRIVATTDCHFVLGAAPTATTSLSFLPSGAIEYFTVAQGEKIAFIRSTADGTAFVTELV